MLYQAERYEDVIMLYTLAQEYLLDNSQNIITSVFAALYQQVRTSGLSQQIWEKAPSQNWEKMIDLTSKLGHNKGSKIYPQNHVNLDCIMPSIPLKHNCLSIVLIWVNVSQK